VIEAFRPQWFIYRNVVASGATLTALRGRANPFDARRHAHAEPWTWHPETAKGLTV
jgi:hypothetical protein